MRACQIAILVLVLFRFGQNLWQDFHGRPAHERFGFRGAILSILFLASYVALLWGAGALCTLL